MIQRRPAPRKVTCVALALALGGCSVKPAIDVTSDDGLAQVAKGNPDAVEAAGKALTRADAADAEKLRGALVLAMQVAPDKVLALVGRDEALAPQSICVPRVDENETPQGNKAALARSRKAIESVTDPALAKAKEACLAELVQSEAAFDHGPED